MDTVTSHPLGHFPQLATTDPDELLTRISGLFSVRSIDFPDERHRFDARLNHCQIEDVGLTYARYGAAMNVLVDQSDYFLQGFPLRGGGDAVVGRASGTLSRERGIMGGPGARLQIRYSSDFEHLIVRINPLGLTRKLSSLIGAPVDPPLHIEEGIVSNDVQLRFLDFLIGELGRPSTTLSPILLSELVQAMMVAYLCNSQHNYSQRLSEGVAEAAPWQVLRAEEYIRANWYKPLTIEALAAVVNTSVRSLFHSFRRSRGISPIAFARRVRLAEARARLVAPGEDTTVTSVAFDCGFGNLSAFARYYQTSYGELPSETLRTAHRHTGQWGSGQRASSV
ncbi:AraC family transcriptional regulator [Rhizobium sp. BK251]|uniref:AraC family transcriptional regulator n=1 Tax=Rhizobium sp. BK251 TaxID=2512125 RepID=UPI00104AC1D4|nr:AraC family transcriptional regulator [Rhizobium sp. BK251]TCL71759.1 AraC family transcriptional regulator [Rhizobium sp. BK251]